jgi:GT2 family glycosyltransferase
MAAPRVSVVICGYTLERWDRLVASVESARAQRGPELVSGQHEVILVIDHEPVLLERARARWPELLVLPNDSTPGLSGARNTGIEVARGEFVAFLDDDAVARDDWLSLLLAQFAIPEVAAVGGGASPVWPAADSSFYPPELYWVVGCSHRGLPESVSDVRNVIGCSMAFRRSTLVEHGGFDLDTGRIGSIPLGCEETELCLRITQADRTRRIVLQPAALVDHHVSAPRVGWRYLGSRSYHEGISKAALSRRLGAADSLSTERGYVSSTLPRAVAREFGMLGRGGARRIAALVVALAGASLGFVRGSLAVRSPASRSAHGITVSSAR